MDLTAIIEIVISLAALYWLLASGCSYVVEAVSSMLLNLRGKALQRFVCEMVLGPDRLRGLSPLWSPRRTLFGGAQAPLRQARSDPLGLFSHGLIHSLHKPQGLLTLGSTPPSYIPAQVFAQTLVDRLATLGWTVSGTLDGAHTLLQALPAGGPWASARAAVDKKLVGGQALSNGLLCLIESFSSKPVSEVLVLLDQLTNELKRVGGAASPTSFDRTIEFLGALGKFLSGLPSEVLTSKEPLSTHIDSSALWLHTAQQVGRNLLREPSVVKSIQDLVNKAPLPESLRDALRPILSQADFDLLALAGGIEKWYDAVMDRATGWFRRHMTYVLFAVGVVAAVMLNVNTLTVARDLARDPSLRTTGVAVADRIVRDAGRESLVQRWVFQDLAARRQWSKTIDTAIAALALQPDKPVSMVGELGRVVGEMRPVLLNSGAYAGVAVDFAGEEFSGEWGDSKKGARSADDTLRLICRAHQGAITADRGAAPIDEGRYRITPLADLPECRWIDKAFTDADRKSPAALYQKFWSLKEIVWAPKLATAIHEVRRVAQSKDAANGAWVTALGPLSEQLRVAIEESGRATVEVHQYLDRIPSLGRDWKPEVNKDWKFWLPSGGWFDVVGWLLTALMVSFGAPFWFDLMNKLVDKRSTGPRPDAAAPSASGG